jgi:choline dehydrogenase-like flavoprotein
MAPYAESPATIGDSYIRQDGPDPFRSTYLRQVGGTTWHWLGTALRLLPSDLELQSRYGVGADWPLRYADLATWYDVIESELGVSGHDDDML